MRRRRTSSARRRSAAFSTTFRQGKGSCDKSYTPIEPKYHEVQVIVIDSDDYLRKIDLDNEKF